MNSELDPEGIGRSPQQLDESFRSRYWQHAAEYGVQYYVAGRFAAHAHFTPVSASILHHSVEMLLKACLAYTDTAAQIRSYRRKNSYGHSLPTLWDEFKRRNTKLDLSAFDEIVSQLHQFETVRYPERLIEQGALFSVGLYEVDEPAKYLGLAAKRPEPQYIMMLPQIDRLIALLFEHTSYPRDSVRTHIAYGEPHAEQYLRRGNATPLV